MPARTEGPGDPEPVRNRCRCGHFPTAHVHVVPAGEGGNFRLDPTGACAICGETSCRAFSPGL